MLGMAKPATKQREASQRHWRLSLSDLGEILFLPRLASALRTESPQASLSNVAVQPVYMIEHIGTVTSDEDRLNIDNIGQNPNTCCTQMFRITAQGSGGTSSAVVMLQSSYGKRF